MFEQAGGLASSAWRALNAAALLALACILASCTGAALPSRPIEVVSKPASGVHTAPGGETGPHTGEPAGPAEDHERAPGACHAAIRAGFSEAIVQDSLTIGEETAFLLHDATGVDPDQPVAYVLVTRGGRCETWFESSAGEGIPEVLLGWWPEAAFTAGMIVLKEVEADDHGGMARAVLIDSTGMRASVPFGGWIVGDEPGEQCIATREDCALEVDAAGRLTVTCRHLCVRTDDEHDLMPATVRTYCWKEGALRPCVLNE